MKFYIVFFSLIISGCGSVEQKIIFDVQSISYKGYHLEEDVRTACLREHSGSINEYMNSGWKVVSSTNKKIPVTQHSENIGSCIGIEYIIERK